MPARILSAGQTVAISPAGNVGVSGTRYLPVQSAGVDVSKPIEDILSFGHINSLGRVQNAVSTCKSDIKTFLAYATGGTGASNYANLLNTDFISTLTGQALAGQVSTINVTPNGFTMSGILASLSVDVANGSFATADLSFVGVGEPVIATAPTTSSFSEQASMPTTFAPVVSTYVSGVADDGCANSFKFNLDLPNETISCLGGSVSGSQVQVASSFLQVAKPPFKASITVEGLAVDAPVGASLTSNFVVGKLAIALPAGQVTARSFNQAVGQAGATYSYTLEDVNAIFTDVA